MCNLIPEPHHDDPAEPRQRAPHARQTSWDAQLLSQNRHRAVAARGGDRSTVVQRVIIGHP